MFFVIQRARLHGQHCSSWFNSKQCSVVRIENIFSWTGNHLIQIVGTFFDQHRIGLSSFLVFHIWSAGHSDGESVILEDTLSQLVIIPRGRKPECPEKTTTFGRALNDSFHMHSQKSHSLSARCVALLVPSCLIDKSRTCCYHLVTRSMAPFRPCPH